MGSFSSVTQAQFQSSEKPVLACRSRALSAWRAVGVSLARSAGRAVGVGRARSAGEAFQ